MGYDKRTTAPESFAADADQGEGLPIQRQSDETQTSSAKEDLRGFAAKFRHTERRGLRSWPGVKRRQGKETFFFYGTLMDPTIAQEVLQLTEPPVLKPAWLRNRGYLRMWGPYPAFVADQNPRVDVKRVACEIEGAERKDRLAMYEGDNYDETKCLINLVTEDGESDYIVARVFSWIGDEDELSEGSFDLAAYKLAKSTLCDV